MGHWDINGISMGYSWDIDGVQSYIQGDINGIMRWRFPKIGFSWDCPWDNGICSWDFHANC